MRKFEHALLIISVIFLSEIIFAQKPVSNTRLNQNESCKVYGSVLDKQSAVIPGGVVTFKSDEAKREIQVSEDGGYEFLLNAGIYEILYSVRYDTWFYKRAKLEVTCISDLNINIYPLPKPVSYGDETPEPTFEMLSLSSAEGDFDAVVIYANKKTRKNSSIYVHAVLTHNKITISAEKIVVDLRKKTVVAKERAWLENGKQRKQGERINLKLTNNNLTAVN